MAVAIELDDVSVIRSGHALLDHVSWTVHDDERWVVLGPNGAGKTTLLSVVTAAMYPTTGRATVLDETLGATDVRELRTRIGVTSPKIADRVPQGESARNVVISAAHAVVGRWNEQYDSEDERRADQILGELGVSHLAHRTYGTLSEGERKRVLIARSLMTDPELLLLDEPGAGLDLGGREDLVGTLNILAEEPASPVIVLVSHHVEEIPGGFTHVLLLREGRVMAAGPIHTTLTAEKLSATYGMRLFVRTEDGRYTARRAGYGHRATPLG